jgi:hypothetical protein
LRTCLSSTEAIYANLERRRTDGRGARIAPTGRAVPQSIPSPLLMVLSIAV